MATIQEMLTASGGSFQKAEQMALDAVANNQHAFWLDLALLLSVQGKFMGARQAQTQYLRSFPDCPRVRFGMAPFALADGELQPGLTLLEYGRQINCWGGHEWGQFNIPMWDGQRSLSGKRVLLHCEGGLGDEILNLRAISWIKEAGGKSVVLCSKDLMQLVATSEADAVIAPGSANSVQCDYWIPSMSAPRLFNKTWDTLWPGQYIFNDATALSKTWQKIIPKAPGKLNIGLRWQGNPKFENQQHRRFPPDDLFSATKFDNVVRWSLQKDCETTLPDDVADLEPFLSSWSHTVAAMSRMDLVITSCTSIAHAAGALNIPTWVVLPVMAYYYACKPGEKTDWYPSMTLYRQETYGDWIAPFKQVRQALETLTKGINS